MRLEAYLARVGAAGAPPADADTLRRLHLAHREAFLFENLTIQAGGSISLALPDLERKFVDEGRGGYCFEHNTLFGAVLRELGFDPVTLLGRVRRGPRERWCRTHMVLAVPQVPGVPRVPWVPQVAQVPGVPQVQNSKPETTDPLPPLLCDVGFGGVGLLEPIELRDGATSVQGGLAYSLRREGQLWVLAMTDASAFSMDMYEFTEDPQTPWDVEVANHFTATHPDSVFRRSLTIQRSSRDERLILRGETLTRYRDGRATERAVDRRELPRLARDLFDVAIPDAALVCDQYPAAKSTT